MKIQIKAIKKSYGKKQVLSDISFCTESGKCIGILGGNGSGKSTLFNILSGICKADEGEFLCDGVNLLKDTKIRTQNVGYVTQGLPLFEELNAYDNLSLWYDQSKLKDELKNGLVKELGINDFLKTPVQKMSGGMKKRVAIACALAHKPKILLLDEPSAALDIVCKETISSYLKNFKNNNGIILLATHDVHEIEMCDELYILKNGMLTKYDYDGDIHRLAGLIEK